jgi:hypothetical protein
MRRDDGVIETGDAWQSAAALVALSRTKNYSGLSESGFICANLVQK